jgi:hypothetical protein
MLSQGTLSANAGSPAAGTLAAPRAIECHCRANGQSYQLGARVCLSTPSGYRMAECRMQQNVTTWQVGVEECSVTS